MNIKTLDRIGALLIIITMSCAFFLIGIEAGKNQVRKEAFEDAQETYTTYRVVVTGTTDMMPCAWEVWKTTVADTDVQIDDRGNEIISDDAIWHTVHISNNCGGEGDELTNFYLVQNGDGYALYNDYSLTGYFRPVAGRDYLYTFTSKQ